MPSDHGLEAEEVAPNREPSSPPADRPAELGVDDFDCLSRFFVPQPQTLEPEPEPCTPQRKLTPISRLLLSTKDYEFLRSLAPIAFYRQEKYNWGHIRLTRIKPSRRIPTLEMSSQITASEPHSSKAIVK